MKLKEKRIFTYEFAGRTLELESGRLAKQADGSVLMRYGDTVLLATVVMKDTVDEEQDFFPLTVDFIEKMYAAGKVPGGFIKRESRPSVDATLLARLTDRPLRPLFPEGFKNAVQIVITVLSYDNENLPEYLAINAASAALTVSRVPFHGPVGAVTVGYVDDEFVINPSVEQMTKSLLELKVAGTQNAVTMVEAGASELSEEILLKAVMFGHEEIKKIVAFQEEIRAEIGEEKYEFEAPQLPEDLKAEVEANFGEQIQKAARIHDKKERYTAFDEVKKAVLEKYEKQCETLEEDDAKKLIRNLKQIVEQSIYEHVRDDIINNHFRADGRALEEIRPISCEAGILPRVHGSSLFTRGETQALATVTLGTPSDDQIVDGLDEETRKKFYLHYNFPPFSVGEVGFLRAPGRRELGHGALAERALIPVLPKNEDFAYTIRTVSEILESNGSSSMATVCAGCLALMDAGVPISAPIAGIANGLVKEGDKFVVLTDIQGLEDHLGDMDFKVAGSRKGITALQMDIKIEGVTEDIMKQALSQAYDARIKILDIMDATLSMPREDISLYAPRMEKIQIPPSKIGEVIGPSGKNIRAIIEETNTTIDIEDDGTVLISSQDKPGIELAKKRILAVTIEPEVGQIYEGTARRIESYGVFVEILPKKDGLLHISEYAHERIDSLDNYVKLGDKMQVKIIEIEQGSGKIRLSRKALLENPHGDSDDDSRSKRPPRKTNDRRPRNHNPRKRRDS